MSDPIPTWLTIAGLLFGAAVLAAAVYADLTHLLA